MARADLILNRYEPLGTAGIGGFGTVQIAWDPRIQRKVAIKTIHLTELDAYRAKLPGAQAAQGEAPVSAAERWRGALPWEDEPNTTPSTSPLDGSTQDAAQGGSQARTDQEHAPKEESDLPSSSDEGSSPVISLAHLPGLDEARTAAMLDDPRIVTVYDFEVRDRTAYLIMEYVDGVTLTRLLRERSNSITLDMVTAVFDAVAGALMTAHAAGVLHLDIKPDNIIITPQGQAKVTDFGLATLADASGAGTTGGGTIGYMPLEQMRREHLDARTDEWSLAALTYEMLTGANPFMADSLEEAEKAIENAELVLPSLCWSDVDEQIDDVMFYALDPDREERYASVADFAEEMDKFLGDAEMGREDLAFAVSETLGLLEDEPEEEEEPEQPKDRRRIRAPQAKAALGTVFSGLFANANAEQGRDADFEGDFDDSEYEEDEQPRKERRRAERSPRIPLGERYSDRTIGVLARVFAIAMSAALAFLAVINMPFLASLGSVQAIIAIILAAACAVGAIIRPHIGALAAYCLLGISFVACGHPIAGAVLVIAAAAWWYSVGHEGMASANVALLAPLAGAIGGSSAVPIIAGAALKPIPALVTTILSSIVAVMLAALGTNSLIGWDAFAHWNYTAAAMSENLIALLTTPSTWTTIAGWILASLALSLLRETGKRWLTIVGIALAVALIAVGSIIFSAPTPQLVISLAAAAAAVLAIIL